MKAWRAAWLLFSVFQGGEFRRVRIGNRGKEHVFPPESSDALCAFSQVTILPSLLNLVFLIILENLTCTYQIYEYKYKKFGGLTIENLLLCKERSYLVEPIIQKTQLPHHRFKVFGIRGLYGDGLFVDSQKMECEGVQGGACHQRAFCSVFGKAIVFFHAGEVEQVPPIGDICDKGCLLRGGVESYLMAFACERST